MNKYCYWWLKGRKGLVEVGRKIKNGESWDTGCPNLQYSAKNAQKLCREGEKPVKVKIIEVSA